MPWGFVGELEDVGRHDDRRRRALAQRDPDGAVDEIGQLLGDRAHLHEFAAHVLEETEQVDFLLIVEGELKKARKDSLIKAIRAIPSVLLAYEINFAEIRNYETLLNDMEMHFMNIRKETKVKYQPKNKT